MLNLAELDPLFIEICRRIRLHDQDARITAERAASKAPRVAGKEAKGNTGDPWTPIHIEDGNSLSLGEQGWTHKLLVQLLFSDKPEWHVPPLARHHALEANNPMALVAEAFARGQSKTDGFKSRIVPVPKAMVREMFGERSVSVADGILKDIAAIDLALRNGLATVAAGGDRDRKLDKQHYARSQPARVALRRQADEWFFHELWARLGETSHQGIARVQAAFLERLAGVARAEFRAALPGIPCASLMRPRAEVRGRQALERGLGFAMRDMKQGEGADA